MDLNFVKASFAIFLILDSINWCNSQLLVVEQSPAGKVAQASGKVCCSSRFVSSVINIPFLNNKLTKLRRHASQVYFTETHFGKIHSGGIQFEKIHIQKINFWKIHFQKIHFLLFTFHFSLFTWGDQRLEVRKCDQWTYLRTWVGARDTCVSKNIANTHRLHDVLLFLKHR